MAPADISGTLLDAKQLIAAVADWSRRDHRVIAAGLLGSRACGDARPDSDADFCILTPRPASLLEELAWIHGSGAEARVSGAIEDYNLVQFSWMHARGK